MMTMKFQAPNFWEHARPVFRTSDGTGKIQALYFFQRLRFFARARKTAPGAGALPFPSWSFPGCWSLLLGAFPL